MKTIIIAEAGVNHNGDIELAKQLIDIAAEAGADYVKFQTFIAEKLVTKKAKKAQYQAANLNSSEESDQLEMLKKLELSVHDHEVLIQHCKKKKIKFLSTGFDNDSLDFLKRLGMDFFKIPSGEITNIHFLQKVGAYNGKVVLSSGMANETEVKQAIDVLIAAGTKKEDIIVLHCTTDYPAKFAEVNLRAMLSMKSQLGVEVGYSDHTEGIEISIAAVALGAKVIEKHFTIDKTLPGPDHKASLEPLELRALVSGIRNVELALGNGIKIPSPSEIKNINVVRKSIHVNKQIKKGSVICETDLVMKRPFEGGISPMNILDVIGRKIVRDLEADHQIKKEDLE